MKSQKNDKVKICLNCGEWIKCICDKISLVPNEPNEETLVLNNLK
jgi:hypothetical protein